MAEIVNDTRVLTLKSPVSITLKDAKGNESEEVISVLQIRKPKGGDLRALDKAEGQMAKMIAFGAQLASVPERVFDKMEVEDFMAALDIVSGFLPASLQTGATS